jgi:hypothetical protein
MFTTQLVFIDLELNSLSCSSNLDEIYGGLIGDVFFGTLLSMWDNNNNTPLFHFYHKFEITKKISSN